jgi:hypothetical protein
MRLDLKLVQCTVLGRLIAPASRTTGRENSYRGVRLQVRRTEWSNRPRERHSMFIHLSTQFCRTVYPDMTVPTRRYSIYEAGSHLEASEQQLLLSPEFSLKQKVQIICNNRPIAV